MLLRDLREEIVETARRMVVDGLVHGAQGNISAQDPDTELIAITPSAVDKANLTFEDLTIIDPHGKVIEGRWKPTSETPMHTIFYRERQDLAVVVGDRQQEDHAHLNDLIWRAHHVEGDRLLQDADSNARVLHMHGFGVR